MDINQAQTILCNIGLLDPPADGVLGPITKWGLSAFYPPAGVPFDGGAITDAVDHALQGAEPLPLAPGNDLAGRIIAAMVRKGHWVARHPDCLNIVYVEGMDADGRPNGNPPNEFNDRRMVIRIGRDGVPKIEGSWEATTEPGRYWTEHPMNPRGAARIAFGQYKSWCVGDYHGVESLLEAAPITVYRDLAQDYKREGAPDVGNFGMHHHWGYDLPKQDLGRSSAGCLVGRMRPDHERFMALIKSDARYLANPNYKFMATILPVEELTGIDMQPPVLRQAPVLPPHLVPTTVPALPAAMTQETIDQICRIADGSELARYRWDDRGVAPRGYIRGMAVTFGEVYSKWKAGDHAARVMAAANSGNDSTDALAWYDSEFRRAGMTNDVAGAPTLRHLFVLLIGLGMRESSGRYCEGRDRSANNVTADTAEAGLFQMSWDARGASPELLGLFAAYSAHPQGFLSVFQDGVKPTDADLSNYGTGQGADFQRLCKSAPAFAAEAAAVGLRTIRKHWGPINRREAEIRPECDRLLQQVQNLIDAPAIVSPVVPPPLPAEPPTMDYAQYQADAAALAAQVQALTAGVRSMQAALDQLKTAIPASTPFIPAPTQLPESPPPIAVPIQLPVSPPPIAAPTRPPTPISLPAPTIDVGALAQILQSLRLPAPELTNAGAILSPIDKALGGQALVGLKTPLAILAYAGMWIMQAFGSVGTATGDKATTTGQVLTALIAAFGGLGLTAKADRGVKALSVLAAAAQKFARPGAGQ